jgi:hypothetical protein
MVAEIYAGLGAFKAAFDIAKGLKDIHDATLRNAAVIELQEKILAAQQSQATLIERIGDLEKQVADFEAWNAEKERYELKTIGVAAFAYMLKPEARRGEPPHFVCTNCYNQRRISVIQYGVPKPGAWAEFSCPACRNKLTPSGESFPDGRIRWLD